MKKTSVMKFNGYTAFGHDGADRSDVTEQMTKSELTDN